MPHITDAIQEWVVKQATVPVDDDGVEPQVCVIEVVCTFCHTTICTSKLFLIYLILYRVISSFKEAVSIVNEYVCLQLGGTVGDIESMPFIEAFRQFQFKVKRENFCNIHVSLIPQVREQHPQTSLV